MYLKTRSHHVNDDLTKYGFEICCISSMADFTQLYTYLKNQNPSSCASVARQTNKTWIVNIPHFADMDRRFWFYPLMCVAYLQIKNFVTCWFLDMFHLQRAKYISKTNCNTVFCIFCVVLKGQCISKPCPAMWTTTWLRTVCQICYVSSVTDLTQTIHISQKPKSIKFFWKSRMTDESKRWIVNIRDFADMDRRFWFHPSMCVAYLQIKNFVTCWVFRYVPFQCVKYISKTNLPRFLHFLHCNQGTMHPKTTSRHVNVNLTKYSFFRYIAFGSTVFDTVGWAAGRATDL